MLKKPKNPLCYQLSSTVYIERNSIALDRYILLISGKFLADFVNHADLNSCHPAGFKITALLVFVTDMFY